MAKKRKRVKNPHVRLRFVDIQNVIGNSKARLTDFELTVRDKLVGKSFRDQGITNGSHAARFRL